MKQEDGQQPVETLLTMPVQAPMGAVVQSTPQTAVPTTPQSAVGDKQLGLDFISKIPLKNIFIYKLSLSYILSLPFLTFIFLKES